MEENYILHVLGMQLVDGESDNINLETTASYVQKNGNRYITYKEYDSENPGQHSRTTIKIDKNNTVTIMKGGEEQHNLILENGKRHKCQYSTSFGSIMIGVYTKSVKIDLDDNGGELNVEYSLDFESKLASINQLNIKIEEANKNVNSYSDSQ